MALTTSRRVDGLLVVSSAGHGDELQVVGFFPQVGHELDSRIKKQEGVYGGMSIGEMGGDMILSHFSVLHGVIPFIDKFILVCG